VREGECKEEGKEGKRIVKRKESECE